MINNLRIIDADGHVQERDANWQELLDPPYRKHAPSMVPCADGRTHLLLEGKIWAEAGEQFNANSPVKLGQILFEKLGLPVIKVTGLNPPPPPPPPCAGAARSPHSWAAGRNS